MHICTYICVYAVKKTWKGQSDHKSKYAVKQPFFSQDELLHIHLILKILIVRVMLFIELFNYAQMS